jgi:hypothetical protein
MLKPKSHLAVGFAERGRLLRDEPELVRHFRRYSIAAGHESIAARYPELQWPLLQRYVSSARNRVYSVTGFRDADGGVVTACVSYKQEQWPPDVGVSTLQVSCEDPRVLECGLAVVNQTLSRGIFEVEVLDDGDALYAIDLNPRAFGFLELDMARGADLPWLWFRSTLEPLVAQPDALSRTPMHARHWLLNFMRTVTRAQAHAANEGAAKHSDSVGMSVSMLGHWSDPVPMIVSNLYLLRHPRSLLRAQFRSLRNTQSQNA